MGVWVLGFRVLRTGFQVSGAGLTGSLGRLVEIYVFLAVLKRIVVIFQGFNGPSWQRMAYHELVFFGGGGGVEGL